MAKLPFIELSNGLRIPILHEDRNVIAIDKPQGWMLAPVSWQNTGRNLAAALTSSLNAGDFWASSRDLKFLRFVHRLDADTSGVLLLVKSPGAMPAYTELFEERKVGKVYLAVVKGVPEVDAWKCRLRLAPMPERPGRMEINNAQGKDTETLFRVVEKREDRALIMCWPLTGRTHQIRLHLDAAGHPILGDELYGHVPTTDAEKTELKLALRAIRLSYRDPFTATQVEIQADTAAFVKLHGFSPDSEALRNTEPPVKPGEHPKAQLVLKARSEHPGRGNRRPDAAPDDDAPRRDWQEDEDSGAFQTETQKATYAEDRPPRRGYDRGPRGASHFGGGERRPFRGPRQSGPREGGFTRKPGGYAGGGQDRPPRRPAYGHKPYGSQGGFSGGASGYGGQRPRPGGYGNRDERGAGGERSGGFRGPAGGRPGQGRPYADRGPRDDRGGAGGFRGGGGGKPGYGRPYEDRGERPSHGGGRFDRGGDDRGNRAGANERRPGVFPSSSKGGLKAGFQHSGGFGGRPERRPFRSGVEGGPFRSGGGDRPFRPRRDEAPREGGRPPSKFGGGGGFGRKPLGKPGGDKPGWGRKPAGRPFKKFSGPR